MDVSRSPKGASEFLFGLQTMKNEMHLVQIEIWFQVGARYTVCQHVVTLVSGLPNMTFFRSGMPHFPPSAGRGDLPRQVYDGQGHGYKVCLDQRITGLPVAASHSPPSTHNPKATLTKCRFSSTSSTFPSRYIGAQPSAYVQNPEFEEIALAVPPPSQHWWPLLSFHQSKAVQW